LPLRCNKKKNEVVYTEKTRSLVYLQIYCLQILFTAHSTLLWPKLKIGELNLWPKLQYGELVKVMTKRRGKSITDIRNKCPPWLKLNYAPRNPFLKNWTSVLT